MLSTLFSLLYSLLSDFFFLLFPRLYTTLTLILLFEPNCTYNTANEIGDLT